MAKTPKQQFDEIRKKVSPNATMISKIIGLSVSTVYDKMCNKKPASNLKQEEIDKIKEYYQKLEL